MKNESYSLHIMAANLEINPDIPATAIKGFFLMDLEVFMIESDLFKWRGCGLIPK